MKTLKIEAPDGHEIDFDPESGEVKFKVVKPKSVRSVTERIKLVADAINDLGEEDDDVKDYRLLLTLFPREHHLVNHQIAILLTKALNEGWTPDWSNSNEVKWYPWFDMRGPSGFRFHGYDDWRSHSSVGSRLCFKTRELTEYAGKTFTAVYEQFLK